MELQTARLVLRPFRASDVPAFYELYSAPEVLRYDPAGPILPEQAQEIINNRVAAQERALPNELPSGFALSRRNDLQLIGNCRLQRNRDNRDRAELAYHLVPRCWNQGYATEMARELLRYGFDTLNLRCIYGLCVPENIASRRVMEKAGMQPQEPVTRYAADGNWYQGAFRDVTYLHYALCSDK